MTFFNDAPFQRERRQRENHTHLRNEAAGADGVAEAHPLLVVGVVAAPQEVLAARVVGLLVQHPAAAVHAHRVAAAEVGLQVGVVAAALVVAALEAAVLVEGDLQGRQGDAQRPGPRPRRPGPLPAWARGSPSPWLVDTDEASSVDAPAGRRVYIAGRLLRWQEQHKRGPRGEEGIFVFSFFSLLS